MNKIILVTIMLLLFVGVFADTYIPAGSVSGTWTIENSPYHIQGDIVVQERENLVIEPGVIIYFDDSKLTVRGKINAIGTSRSKILFTAALVGRESWKGIILESAYDSNFESVIIEKVLNNPALSIINSNDISVRKS